MTLIFRIIFLGEAAVNYVVTLAHSHSIMFTMCVANAAINNANAITYIISFMSRNLNMKII